MNIKNYWSLAPSVQQSTLETVKQADLEAYAEEHRLLVHRGKLVKPEDYPCECEMESPSHCFQEINGWETNPTHDWTNEEQDDKQCHCPCHSYWIPD